LSLTINENKIDRHIDITACTASKTSLGVSSLDSDAIITSSLELYFQSEVKQKSPYL
jgi:hypothetical protein